MKKTVLLLIFLLSVCSSNCALADTNNGHASICPNTHQTFLMVDESSACFNTSGNICGDYNSSEPHKTVLFPSHSVNESELKQYNIIKPLEGGYAGIFYYPGYANGKLAPVDYIELLIIPDTYTQVSFLGPLEGRMQYVALPNNSQFTVKSSAFDNLLFSTYKGPTFLVIKGTPAHEYCVKKGLPFAFRKEYCHYIDKNGVFSAELFYECIPNMIDSTKDTVPQSSSLSLSENDSTELTSEERYPYIDGSLWGYLDANGNPVIQPKYSYADLGNSGIYIVASDTQYGLINGNDDILLPLEYSSVEYIAPDVYLAKKQGNQYIIHPAGNRIIDMSLFPDIFHANDGLLQYFERVETPSGMQNVTGLLDYNGNILCEPSYAKYIHYPQRKLIGITYLGENPGATIIDYDGIVYKEFIAGGQMMPSIDVPAMKIYDGNEVVETVVYFKEYTHRLTAENGLQHCGAFECYVDLDGNFYPINQESIDTIYASMSFAQKDGSNNVLIFSYTHQIPYEIFAFPKSLYGSYTNHIESQNGYAIIAQKQNIPFYVSTDLWGRNPIDVMNNMVYKFTHEIQCKHITLHPANEDGIAICEVLNNNNYYSYWITTLNASDENNVWYPIFMYRLHGKIVSISHYQYGHAVIYNEEGKAGLVDANGLVIVDMIYDHILLYPNFAVAIDGNVQKQDILYGYGNSVIDNHGVVVNGTSQIIPY